MFKDFELKPYPGEDDLSYTKRKAYYYRFIKPRLDYSDKLMDMKLKNTLPLNSDEKQEIDDFWSQYLPQVAIDKLIDYRYYEFFKTVMSKGEKLHQYITHSFFALIDDYYTNPQQSKFCDDKNWYDLFFHDVNQPKTVFRKVRELFLDDNYNEISLNEAISRAKERDEVVLKIATFSAGGEGLLFWKSGESEESLLTDFLQRNNNVVCQEVIKQHPELCRLNSSSVNTVRVMTLYFGGQVHVLSSVLRMGVNESRTDNGSAGGIVCGIKENGQLKNYARDLSGNTFLTHPNGTVLESIIIPNFGECLELAKTLAKRFIAITRLISWDFAVDENGHPLLIELSLSGGGFDVHHVCNGPILGELVNDVVADVSDNSFTLKSILKSF